MTSSYEQGSVRKYSKKEIKYLLDKELILPSVVGVAQLSMLTMHNKIERSVRVCY